MSGIKYLLDTNFILGILKSNLLVHVQLSSRQLLADECSYSAITRMELLGFQSIAREEESLIVQKLGYFTYLPLTRDIEDRVIGLRRSRKIKLPDAIIAATALCYGIELLTLDRHLLAVMRSGDKSECVS